MDARSFGSFLVDRISEAAKTIEQNLINTAYEKLEQSHRASGALNALNEITSKMDNLLNDFYGQGDASAAPAAPAAQVVEAAPVDGSIAQ